MDGRPNRRNKAGFLPCGWVLRITDEIQPQHPLASHSRSQRPPAPFGQHQESRLLLLIGFTNTIVTAEPIRFIGLDSEHAQSDGKSMNRGLPVWDPA